MPTVLRSRFADVARALLAALAQSTGLPAARVQPYRSGDELPPLANGGNDLVVQFGPPRPDEDVWRGAGRTDTRLTRLVTVTVRTESEVDPVTTAWVRLLDPQLGQFALEEAVLDALAAWFPVDGQQNALLVQPARLVPEGELPPRAVPKAGNWTASALAFELVYMAALNQSRQ